MIGRLDRLWFRLLSAAYRWIVGRVASHCRRETMRRLRRQVAWQKAHLN